VSTTAAQNAHFLHIFLPFRCQFLSPNFLISSNYSHWFVDAAVIKSAANGRAAGDPKVIGELYVGWFLPRCAPFFKTQNGAEAAQFPEKEYVNGIAVAE